MKLQVEVDEITLRRLVTEYLKEKLGTISFGPDNVIIEVKTKQNYKAEWEAGSFRARLSIGED